MNTTKKLGLLVLFIAFSLSIAYKLYDVKKQKKEEVLLVNKSKSDIPVTTATVKFEEVNQDFTYPGTFEPNCEVTVISESQGKVVEHTIVEGNFIPEGEPMALLDNDLASYQLETAEAAYLKAQDDLRRFENLSPGEAVTEQQLAEMNLALKNAKCAYLTIKKQHGNSIIKAPLSGTISKRYIVKGSFIAPGSPVADIIDTRKMIFNAMFTAIDLTRVKVGQKVKLTTGLYPGESFIGTIKVIGVKPDNSKRYMVQTEVVNNQSKPLIDGIDGTVHLKFTSQKCLVVPRNCITGSIIQPKVYVVTNNQVKLRSVVISAIADNQAIVESGLVEGECVVLSGQINLKENARVIVQNNRNI